MKRKQNFWNSPINTLSPKDREERRKIVNERARIYRKNLKGEALIAERAKRAKFAREWRAKNREKCREINRDRYNTGEIADVDKIMFYGYKEPLRKFEKGFGYKGVLIYSKDKEKIQCHFCGKMFRALNNGHLGKVHGMTAEKYKEEVGLSPISSLVGEATREKLFARPYNPTHMIELKKAQEKRRQIIKETGKDPQSHKKMRLEIHNQRGTCPDQLLDKIEKTIKSFGRVPNAEEFARFHNGKFLGSIKGTFGSWTEALNRLGKRTNKSLPLSREILIDELQNFYKVHKRSPRWSDFNRGLLRDASTYYKHFKNLNHARLLANVPLVVWMGRKRYEDYIPKEEERKRMLLRA